jgi:hypothetical protein
MQNDFEKNIEKKLKHFNLEPAKHVWQEIYHSLQEANAKKKSGKVVYKFIFLLFLVTATGLANLYFNFFPLSSSLKEHAAPKIVVLKDSIQLKQKLSSEQNQIAHSITLPRSLQTSQSKHVSTLPVVFDAYNNFLFMPKDENIHGKKKEVSNALASAVPSNSTSYASIQNNVVSNKNLLPLSLASKSSFPAITENKAPSVNHISIPAHNKITSPWSLLIGIGATNTVDKNGILMKKETVLYTPQPSVTNSNPLPDTARYMRKSFYGYHFTIGLQYMEQFSKHWKWYSGLQYTYASNKQEAGKKTLLPLNVSLTSDTAYNAFAHYIKVPYHYLDEKNLPAVNTIRNYSHSIQLPVSIAYVTNPNAARTLEIKSGIITDWMLAYKWLLPDGRYGKFYYSESLTNTWIFNWHADAVLTLKNKTQIGMQMKHSITPLAKYPVKPSLYWNHFTLYATIPLK